MSAHPSNYLDLNSDGRLEIYSSNVAQTPVRVKIARAVASLECSSKDGVLELNIPPTASEAKVSRGCLVHQVVVDVSEINRNQSENALYEASLSHDADPHTSACTRRIIQPLRQDNSFSEVQLDQAHSSEQKIGDDECELLINNEIGVGKLTIRGKGEFLEIRDEVVGEIKNPTFLERTTLTGESDVLRGITDSFPKKDLDLKEDTCISDVNQDEAFQAFEPVSNLVRENLDEDIRVSLDSGPIYMASGQSQASASWASQHDCDSVPVDVSVPPSADMNAFLEIEVTNGLGASEYEYQEGCIDVLKVKHATVTNVLLPAKIQDGVEYGGVTVETCAVSELVDKVVKGDALDWNSSYVDNKQFSEAQVEDGGFESLPNGGFKQEMAVQPAQIVLHEVAGNEKMKPYPVSGNMNDRICFVDSSSAIKAVIGSQVSDACAFQCAETETVSDRATVSFGDANPDSQLPVTEDCVSPSHEDQNRDTHVSEISTTEERIQTIDVGSRAELGGGLSMLTENQTKVDKNEHITGTVVEDLDSSPCRGLTWKTGDEVIKDMSPPEEFSDIVAKGKAKGIEDVLRSPLLDDIGEKSVDSAREVGLDRNQNVPNAEPVPRFDLAMLKPEFSSERENGFGNNLEPEKEGEFSVSNLVWGKVKSHPWWPGQIFDSSDASERAMKYKKRDSFLVAYFGDKTFAWNDASSLHHFRTHYSQMERQSNSESFHTAVDYALDEVRRRIELGMVCSCTPKEEYVKLNSQITENAGIRREARKMDGLNNSISATLFESGKLLQYIKALAPYPCGGGDRLELKIAQAQLLSFYRLKGYYQLPEFHVYGGLLEDDVASSHSGERNHSQEVTEHEPPVSVSNKRMLSNKAELKGRDSSSHKRKYGSDGGLHPRRKQRSLSDLMAGKKAPSCLVNGGKNGVTRASTRSASSAVKKQKAVNSFSEDSSARSTKRRPSFSGDIDTESSTPQSFKVGECIRRIASQLTGSPPILKCSGETFQKSAAKLDRGNENDGIDGSPYVPEGSYRRSTFPKEYSSPDEMLSQLCLAARDPMKGYSFLSTIVVFFSELRDSICLECASSRKQKRSLKICGGKTGIEISKPYNTENSSKKTFDFEEMSDSYWTDRIIQSSPEEPSRRSRKRKGESQFGIHTELDTSSFEAEDPFQLSIVLDFEEQNLDDDYVPHNEKPSRKYRKRKRKSQLVLPGDKDAVLDFQFPSLGDPVNGSDENMEVNDFSPTALLMSFSESESIPSEMNLNKIFRRFGPLKESQTEVLRDSSSARVVFKKQTDAEVALSSAAKFSIFGSVHVSYQLRFKV